MITLTGLNSLRAKTQKQRAMVKQQASAFVREKTHKVLKDLVLNTPQWSGSTAASWRIVLNGRDTAPPTDTLKGRPWTSIYGTPALKFKGDKTALGLALAANSQNLLAIKYNSNISLVNAAPYADRLASNTSDVEKRLRAGNFIPADLMAIAYTRAKHNVKSTLKLV